MPTTTQDHIEVQELVFPAAGERREPGGRPERTGGGARRRGGPDGGAGGAGASRRSLSMRPSTVPVAAVVCGKLSGCPGADQR